MYDMTVLYNVQCIHICTVLYNVQCMIYDGICEN